MRILVLLFLVACARPPHPDVVVLRRTFAALHPGLQRYLTPAQLDAAYAELSAALTRARTPAEAFVALSVFTAKLRCGHTYPNFFNQTEAVQHALFEGPRVPFLFRWLDGKMVVTRSFTAALTPGTEIVSLAGVPAPRILERLLTIARADGGNDAKRIAYVELHGDSRYEAFDVFLPLFFPQGRDLPLEVRRPDGGTASTRVAWMSFAERNAALPAEPEGALWSLTFLAPDVGYLRMPTWVTYHTKWDWQGDLQRTMETLVTRQARLLVVDLRGNEGGTDVGDELLRHLIDAPLPAVPAERRTRYRSVPAALRPNLDTWDPSFFDRGAEAHELGGGWYRLGEPASEALSPRPPRFHGKLVVLIDASNSSATFQFAQRVRQAKLGTLVGEPTGGNQRGINGGSFFFLRLPTTGLEVDLPLVGVFPPGDPPDAGLVPDVLVRPTARDLAEGRDPALLVVRE